MTYEFTIDELRERGSLKWSTYPDAIGAWVAEMDFDLAPAVQDALEYTREHRLTGYIPMSWRAEIKNLTAAFNARRYDWEVNPARVHAMPDVLTVLSIVMTRWLEPGSGVVVPTPCYMPFVDMPDAFGHHRIEQPMIEQDGRWTIDLDALDRAFREGAKLLILCNPQNPTGTVATREELLAICEIVERHHAMVFSDEIHAPLVYPGATHVPYASISPEAARHTVTAQAASKAFNIAGLKCAQMILTNDDHQNYWTSQGHGLPFESTPMGLAGTIAAYSKGEEWLAATIDYLRGNRDLLVATIGELMPDVHVHAPQGTYLAWLDCRDLGLANPMEHFLAAGVAMNDGATCGEVGRGFVRFNFATSRPIVVEAIERMAGC